MATDQRWKWAGIVSVVSIAGVLITDIVANVVGGYISEQIKASWLMPGQDAAPSPTSKPEQDLVVSSLPAAPKTAPQAQLAAVTSKPLATEAVAVREPDAVSEPEAAPDPQTEIEPDTAVAPESMPLPPPPSMELSGTVEKVIDTGTLEIEGETVMLAGVQGLGSPYRDQLAKFIEEQGSQIRCTATGERHVCYVGSIDLALAALTNGAARLATDATAQYQKAAEEAKRNHRGIFQ
jgi:endonuclease YncB( thermonuclease family)